VEVVTHSGHSPRGPLRMHRVDARRLVLALERRAIARKRQISLRRLALPPAGVSATDVLTSLALADPAVDHAINE
jgi:hypothetical protein